MSDNELRVPTIALNVEIHYIGEELIRGRIFLPARAQRHLGPTRPEEWLNQESLFFPVAPDEGGAIRILNKRFVTVVSMAAHEPALDMPQAVGTPRRVEVECGNLRLEGIVYIDMPATQSRLLDFINRTQWFICLLDGERRHLIQRKRITSITEIKEA